MNVTCGECSTPSTLNDTTADRANWQEVVGDELELVEDPVTGATSAQKRVVSRELHWLCDACGTCNLVAEPVAS